MVYLLCSQYQELAVPEQALALLQDVYNTLRALVPTPEVRDFLDAVYKYQVKVSTRQNSSTKSLGIMLLNIKSVLTGNVILLETEARKV